MEDPKGLLDQIEKRELNPYHVFMASFLAGLHSMGMLNQATVTVAARGAGRKMALYLQAKGDLPPLRGTLMEKAATLIEHLQKVMPLGMQVQVEVKGDEVEVKVEGATCKFCPKGVGGAELEGTLCPYPALLASFADALLCSEGGIKVKPQGRRPLVKEAGVCKMVLYRVQAR